MPKKVLHRLICFTSVCFFIINALAAPPQTSLPGTASPEVVSRSLSEESPSSATTSLAAPPVLTSPQKPSAGLSEQVKKITFKLNSVILEGNHVYSTSVLQAAYQNDLHKTISVGRLFDIVQEITNYYRNNGYILSRAILPPQTVANGIVRIQIIEGYVGKVSVTGNPRGAKALVQVYGNKIIADRPLQLSHMETYLLLANEIPGTQVKAELTPSKTLGGAADLSLITQNNPVVGYLSYDNYGNRYIGPQQMTGNIGFNSFLISGDAAQFTYVKTPKGAELSYMDGNYTLPLSYNNMRWQLGLTHTQTHPLFVLQPVQVDGLSNNGYTTVSLPLIRTLSKTLTLRGGFNYLNSHVTTLDLPLYNDSIRSLDVGATFTNADSWRGNNYLNADLRQGLPFWGYSGNTNINTATTSRPGGHAVYTKLAAQFARQQLIKGPFSAYGIVQGQWAGSALLSWEQFAYGGSLLGRGYDSGELIGDEGAAGSLELRYDYNVERFYVQRLQLYAFYDAGVIWNFNLVGGVPRKVSATSTGLGTRFYLTKYVSGNLMWAQPLTKQVAAEELIGEGWRPRVFFSIVANFY